MHKSIAYVQISDTETFGVAIAEAMSCGTHVVVSKRGAIPEVVGNHGVYVDHNDPDSVAAGIVDVLKLSPLEYKVKSNVLRNHIQENFSYIKRRDKIEKIINGILPKK
jgi:glycosyltransferase involved in cell wall biosynthesis